MPASKITDEEDRVKGNIIQFQDEGSDDDAAKNNRRNLLVGPARCIPLRMRYNRVVPAAPIFLPDWTRADHVFPSLRIARAPAAGRHSGRPPPAHAPPSQDC